MGDAPLALCRVCAAKGDCCQPAFTLSRVPDLKARGLHGLSPGLLSTLARADMRCQSFSLQTDRCGRRQTVPAFPSL